MRVAKKTFARVDTRTARIYFPDGRVDHFKNDLFAFALWLALPKGTRVAFRGRNDTRPVYPWDRADRLPGREP